jgi:hypothetical protein
LERLFPAVSRLRVGASSAAGLILVGKDLRSETLIDKAREHAALLRLES